MTHYEFTHCPECGDRLCPACRERNRCLHCGSPLGDDFVAQD